LKVLSPNTFKFWKLQGMKPPKATHEIAWHIPKATLVQNGCVEQGCLPFLVQASLHHCWSGTKIHSRWSVPLPKEENSYGCVALLTLWVKIIWLYWSYLSNIRIITFSTVKYCNLSFEYHPFNIFTLCYFHNENNKTGCDVMFLIMTLCCVTALKPFIFETNMFEKQRKCNKQKIQCFADEYGIYFTCEAGFL
jgi:hypothetical protein